jgi:hypothetical protein
MLCFISRVAYASDHSQVRTGYALPELCSAGVDGGAPAERFVIMAAPSSASRRAVHTALARPARAVRHQRRGPARGAGPCRIHAVHVGYCRHDHAADARRCSKRSHSRDSAGAAPTWRGGLARASTNRAQAPTAQQTFTPAQLVAISDAPPASEFPETRLISRIAQAPARYTPYSFRYTSPAGDLDKDSQFYTDTVSDLHREAPAYARVERERSLPQSAWHTLCVAPPRRKGASPAKAALACVDVGQPSVSASG